MAIARDISPAISLDKRLFVHTVHVSALTKYTLRETRSKRSARVAHGTGALATIENG